jgi:heat-inducible transcriptional repressor
VTAATAPCPVVHGAGPPPVDIMRVTMLEERKAAILRAVVEQYIETAQPVGSARVAEGVGVSSATVRNEMVLLEQQGFLAQPHTSAGRIPTDKGYRFFVDSIDRPAPLDPSGDQQIRDFFDRSHDQLERMLRDTSALLSDLTGAAAVVVGPSPESARVRSIQLVGLTGRVALLVVVLSNGVVEKHTLELETEASDAALAAAGAHLTAAYVDRTIDAGPAVAATGDEGVDRVVAGAVDALARGQGEEPEEIYVGGTARMVAAFDAVEQVREILGVLEQQFVVVSLIRDVLDRGLKVAIGHETGVAPLAECSLVVAPYDVDGEPAGTIGVLGPTRMNYPQALAAVAVVSSRLGRRLTEG